MLELRALMAAVLPGAGEIEIEPLRAGLVNRSYRIERGAERYALRVDAADAAALGFDRRFEARVLTSAASAGLAPVTVYADAARGLWVARWVEGRSWQPAEAASATGMRRVVSLIRAVHGLSIPAGPRRMSAWDWVEYYRAGQLGPALHAHLARLAREVWERLPAASGATVLCHSDLHLLNLIDRGASLLLLDWEYAHVADPLWDLGGWSANNDYSRELRAELLGLYLNRTADPPELLRLELLTWLYDYVCLLWSAVYLSRASAADTGIEARSRLLAARLAAAPL